MEKPCDYCNEKPAKTTCEMCGADVCPEHKKGYGCSVCEGEMRME